MLSYGNGHILMNEGWLFNNSISAFMSLSAIENLCGRKCITALVVEELLVVNIHPMRKVYLYERLELRIY